MRIISGIYKSRILKSPESNSVRPTSDRAKETLFNILNNRIDFNGLICLDLFCGTGNLGLECISRGAEMCYFVDENVSLVKKNVGLLNAEENSKIIKSEVINFLNGSLEKNFELIICDPPYNYKHYDQLLSKLSEIKTTLMLEHSGRFELNENFEKYVILKRKTGTVNFTFFDFEKPLI